jgi:hypothetical protein
VGEGVVGAVGLSPAAIRVSYGGTDRDLTAGYEREFREQERGAFDIGPLHDGSLYGSRRSWRNRLVMREP